MSRKVLLQLVLPLIGLSVLFWLLAFAPGDKHYQPALLEMSVILRDGDGNVSAMRKGMEQAAKDLNVELRFLTPAEDNSAVEQVQLLEHEVSGAAPAGTGGPGGAGRGGIRRCGEDDPCDGGDRYDRMGG